LALARLLPVDPVPGCLSVAQPLLRGLLARIPLDNEVHVLLGTEDTVLQSIVSAVQAHQQGQRGQGPRPRHHPLQDIDEFPLAVLDAGAQLTGETPAFFPQIPPDRGVAIIAGIGGAYPFFLGARVIQGKHVEVEAHMAGAQGCDGHLSGLEKLHQGNIDPLHQRLSVLVEPQPQARRRGHPLDVERLTKERVIAHVANRLEVAFAEGEQPQVTFDDIAVGNAMQQGQLIDRGLQPREPNGAPQEREARVRGMDFL